MTKDQQELAKRVRAFEAYVTRHVSRNVNVQHALGARGVQMLNRIFDLAAEKGES